MAGDTFMKPKNDQPETVPGAPEAPENDWRNQVAEVLRESRTDSVREFKALRRLEREYDREQWAERCRKVLRRAAALLFRKTL
jgi:hypothetical protein